MFTQDAQDTHALHLLMTGDYDGDCEAVWAACKNMLDGVANTFPKDVDFTPYGYAWAYSNADEVGEYIYLTGFTAYIPSKGLHVTAAFPKAVMIAQNYADKDSAPEWDVKGDCSTSRTVYSPVQTTTWNKTFREAVTKASPIVARYLWEHKFN